MASRSSRPSRTGDEETCETGESSLLLSKVRTKADYSDHPNGSLPLTSTEIPSLQQQGLKGVWNHYYGHLEKRPLFVKSVTAFFIMGCADLCAQGIDHLRGTSGAVDWPRAARFGAFGLLGAPWTHYYFYYLDKGLPPTPEPFTRTTFMKVFLDQFIQAPAMLVVIICLLSLMKFEGFEGMKTSMRDNYVTSLIANWKLWLPASLVNQAFVKPELRVLYVNVVFFVWIVILSTILNSTQ
jgi:hypothetical protein